MKENRTLYKPLEGSSTDKASQTFHPTSVIGYTNASVGLWALWDRG